MKHDSYPKGAKKFPYLTQHFSQEETWSLDVLMSDEILSIIVDENFPSLFRVLKVFNVFKKELFDQEREQRGLYILKSKFRYS